MKYGFEKGLGPLICSFGQRRRERRNFGVGNPKKKKIKRDEEKTWGCVECTEGDVLRCLRTTMERVHKCDEVVKELKKPGTRQKRAIKRRMEKEKKKNDPGGRHALSRILPGGERALFSEERHARERHTRERRRSGGSPVRGTREVDGTFQLKGGEPA